MKLKIIYTALLLLLCSVAFGQTYGNVGVASWQRAPTSKGYFYRANIAPNKPGFFYLYTQQQIDSLLLLKSINYIFNQTSLQSSASFHIDGSGSFERASLGATTINVLNLDNTTLATAIAPTKISPALQFTGNAWDTNDLRSSNFGYRLYMLPVTGTSPYPSLQLDYGISNSYLSAATFTKGNLLISGVIGNFITLTNNIDASAGLAHAYYENTNIGPVADGDVLVGLDLNDTFSRGNAIATAGTITPGTGYTPGTYTNVTLPSNHSNTAAHATIIVDGAGHITSVTFPSGQGGARYTIGQSITVSNTAIGGTGSGFSFLVGTVSQYTGLINYALRARNAPSIFAPSTSTYGGVIIPPGSTYSGSTDGTLWNDGTNLWGRIGGVATQITNQSPVILSGSSNLDFPSTVAGSNSSLDIVVTGAAMGDVVSLGLPNGFVAANNNFNFLARCSATDTVTVTLYNNSPSTYDPGVALFKVKVFK